MFDPQMALLSTVLGRVAAAVAANPTDEAPWSEARSALAPTRAKETEIAALVDAKDVAGLQTLLAEWSNGKRLLPEQDREVLRRAMTAFRKTLKITRLDSESSFGGGPMSSGRHSSIVGITPPNRYGRDVWDELVRQKRLLGGRHGVYELPPE
jgi:hypothetical protein